MAGYLPAIRAVQGDCEAVYVPAEMSDDDPDHWINGKQVKKEEQVQPSWCWGLLGNN